MSRKNNASAWIWRRWISAAARDEWIARLEAADCSTWTLTERPGASRFMLAVYSTHQADLTNLRKKFGGRVHTIAETSWLPKPTPPTRIGRALEIVHGEPRGGKVPAREKTRLYIPHGIAFGSGEHATTFMLLRELAKVGDWTGARVLDLGTGSGALALAARKFGAVDITATDFDPNAIRTACQNEALNFSEPIIGWHCTDVRKLRATRRYDLVLANLFSELLIETARPVASSVAPGGRLWLSGILVSQARAVSAAYRRQGLKPAATSRRGKWVMLQFTTRPAAK